MADLVIVVASYNMSFMSDKTDPLKAQSTQRASEATFLRRALNESEKIIIPSDLERQDALKINKEEYIPKQKTSDIFHTKSYIEKRNEEQKQIYKNQQIISDLKIKKEKRKEKEEKEIEKENKKIEKNRIRRQFWINANEFLFNFIQRICDKPFVIGLQEMNLTLEGDTGSNAVTKMIEHSQVSDRNYHICREINIEPNWKPALSIIYDKAFGEPLAIRIIDNWCQQGRPLLIVITKKKYVFVNIHGGQEPKDGDPYQGGDREKFNKSIIRMNKDFLEKSVETLCRCTKLDNEIIDEKDFRIFIMGDLNDRYDAITEFTIFGKKLKYNGESPKSCCHNWDSACSDTYYREIKEFKEKEGDFYPEDDKRRITYKGMGIEGITGGSDEDEYCQTPNNNIDEHGKMSMPDIESKVENYRFKGDKVFGEIPVPDSDIEMFIEDKMFEDNDKQIKDDNKDNKNKPSTRSDHELVFATFKLQDTFKGGKRRSKTRKHHSKKSKNNRRTR
jgi:hypothetical protein